MESELILLIQEHPCLFDMKSKYYRDQNVRSAVWEEIANKLNTSGTKIPVYYFKDFMYKKRTLLQSNIEVYYVFARIFSNCQGTLPSAEIK